MLYHACMKNTLSRALSVIATTCVLASAGTAQAKVYRVYYLGGQSNMDGYGRNSDLSDKQRQPVDGCMIYRGRMQGSGEQPQGAGVWATLTPGFGGGYTSDGTTNTLGDRFGPELSFGAQMQKLHPDANIAIVKYSRGGSSIALESGGATWDVDDRREKNGRIGINQFDHALKTIDMALTTTDIDGDGEADTLIPCGIVWMQGESDGTHEGAANAYEENLDELMNLLRAALRVDELPVVVGRISDSNLRNGNEIVWKFGETIRAAQKQFCDDDPAAALVTSTDAYGYSDPYHYDSEGFFDLGQEFAKAMHALETGNASD